MDAEIEAIWEQYGSQILPKEADLSRTVKHVKTLSVDEELAEHLKQAESHIISAINLFSREKKPVRGIGYLKRLEGAQETITALYRGELVRIRGPLRQIKRKRR